MTRYQVTAVHDADASPQLSVGSIILDHYKGKRHTWMLEKQGRVWAWFTAERVPGPVPTVETSRDCVARAFNGCAPLFHSETESKE